MPQEDRRRARSIFSRPTRAGLVAFLVLALIPALGLSLRSSRLGIHDLQLYAQHSAGQDSWRPIRLALEQLASGGPSRLYEQTYFRSADQFVYSPLSLVLFRWVNLPPFLDWRDPDGLNRLSWWVLLAMAAVTAAIFLRTPRSAGLGAGTVGVADRAALVVLAFASTLFFYPAVKAYTVGNLQSWLNLSYVIALLLWLVRRRFAAGLVLGVACVVKPQMSLFLIWALLRGETGLALGMICAAAPLALISLVAFGWPIHAEYVKLMGVVSRRGESYYASHCVNGLLNRMLFLGNNLKWDGSHTQLPYNPLVHAVTTLSSFALLVPSLLWRRRRSAQRDPLDFCTALLTFTMAAPVAFEHHYGFLVPVFWIVLARILEGTERARPVRLALLAAAFLMCTNFLWPTRHFAATSLNFVQSYLFFGALILLVLMYRLRAAEPLAAGAPAARGDREAPARIPAA